MKRLALARFGERLGWIVGHAGILGTVALTVSVCVDVAMRWSGLDTEWVFDLNLFAIMWLAAAGAALTALHHAHVTAGIALERFFPRARVVLNVMRAVIIIPFLLLVAVSGAIQAIQAFHVHQTTFDLAAWPVWIAQIAIPIGMFAWAAVEFAFTLRGFKTPQPHEPDDLTGAE